MVAGHVTAYPGTLSYPRKHSTSLQPWSNVDFHHGSLLPCIGNISRCAIAVCVTVYCLVCLTSDATLHFEHTLQLLKLYLHSTEHSRTKLKRKHMTFHMQVVQLLRCKVISVSGSYIICAVVLVLLAAFACGSSPTTWSNVR